MTNYKPQISFSVVSHGQSMLIRDLLTDLASLSWRDFEVIITLNTSEDEALFKHFEFPITVIKNYYPKGFGENHNAAFCVSKGVYFAVLNPDIRIHSFDANEILYPFSDNQVCAVAPQVVSATGSIEDNARKFPTFLRLFKRIVLRNNFPDYALCIEPYPVDWVAGMFIIFRKDIYKNINGFDDRRFYMYMEDVDICRRLKDAGYKILLNPKVSVVHMAQRASHSNLKHMRWHLVSAFRYLTGL